MRDGGIAKQQGNFCYAEAFVVEQIFGMLHTLALIKIKDGGSE